MTQFLPIFLELTSKPVLLIGGGLVAHEKLVKLLATGAQVKVIARQFHPETKALILEHGLVWEERSFLPADANGQVLIVSAVNDPESNQKIARVARDRRVLINAVDVPEASDFYFAAQVERGPLQLAISTQGLFPGVARSIRLWLEELFPTDVIRELNELVDIRRVVRKRIPDPVLRMQALREQLHIWNNHHSQADRGVRI